MRAHLGKSSILSLAALTLGVGIAVAATPAAAAMGWEFCAREHGFCNAPHGAIIHYGRDGAFTSRRSPPGGLPCDNAVFGDPLVGIHKLCFVSY
jgi:hypothetical protein